MKSKTILVSLIAIFAVVLALNLVSALSVEFLTEVNGMDLGSTGNGKVPSLEVGSVIPVLVEIKNNEAVTLTDATVKVTLDKADFEVKTSKFDLPAGSSKTILVSMKIPATIKETLDKDDELQVKLSCDQGTAYSTAYDVLVQRKAYSLDLLSIDVSKIAIAGSSLSIDVVLKNRGSHRIDDAFVVARIPALDVEKKVYFSDLTPVDQDFDDGKQDAEERTISLKLPSDVKAGVYTLELEAYNDDASTTVTKSIAVSGSDQGSNVLVPVTAKDVASGASVSYDLIIVNAGNSIASYEIVPETSQNLVVSVSEPVVTVSAGSSKTVKVNVQAGNAMGTYNFAVNVNSQGQLVQKVNLVANVGKAGIATNNIVILTIVLAVVFVVLLIVLIVLLTRKPEKVEEFGESYY